MEEDLFSALEPEPPLRVPPPDNVIGGDAPREARPLAERLRPKRFEDLVGQEALVGPDAPLGRLIRADRVPSMILWGPPGSGKTTLAHLIAAQTNSDFVPLSAVTAGLKEVRSVIDSAKSNRRFNRRTLLFIDEIHRFNKAQQDAFLPHVESGMITLVGATTENPSFSVIAPLLSRCRVFVLKPLEAPALDTVLRRGLAELNAQEPASPIVVAEDGFGAIVKLSDGDARRALGMLELAVSVQREVPGHPAVSAEDVARAVQRHLLYDKTGEEHYNLISALHKTLRSSDPHAAAYWVGRMLTAGEDPLFLARRMVRFAAEDIGLADPQALSVAMECMRAYQQLGSPEGEIALYQCALYLALAPKSNAVYRAEKAVRQAIEDTGTLPVPLHLRNAPTALMKDLGYGADYTYDHDAAGGFIAKQGLPDELRERPFYTPTDRGWEGSRAAFLREVDESRDREG